MGTDHTLLYYTKATRNLSAFVAVLDDEQQTMTVGLDVTSVLTVVTAAKERAESLARAKLGAAATPSDPPRMDGQPPPLDYLGRVDKNRRLR